MIFKLNGARVISKKENPSKDGQRMFYNLNVEKDGDVFQFPCEQSVFRAVEVLQLYDFDLDYTKMFWDGKLKENMRLVYCSSVDAAG